MSSCPPVKSLVEAVESDDLPAEIEDHLELCEACASIMASLREESEGLTISVGDLWVKERISCPHRDILTAHVDGSLVGEQSDWVRFHLEIIECPYCQSDVEELEESAGTEGVKRLDRVLDDAMRRSAAALDQLRRG